MGPAGTVDESVGGEGGVVREMDAGFGEGGYVGDMDVDEVFVEEGEEVGGVVEDADVGAYPDDAAVGDQLFGFGVVVVFCLLDGTVVYPSEDETE